MGVQEVLALSAMPIVAARQFDHGRSDVHPAAALKPCAESLGEASHAAAEIQGGVAARRKSVLLGFSA